MKLIQDRETKRPKGFGFVEMEDEGAQQAIAKLDNTDFMGRTIRVTEANPRK
ncbi:Rna-binding protein [Helicobacter heilmannii ASB1.4]|nr:Rna-binding protein [Helicobacter heilmannii ASB1.4]